MPCHGRSQTPLERFAESLQTPQGQESEEAIPMLFPMYTVPLEELLRMEEVRPHEHLKARGLVVQFDASMGRAAFVSHQWVGGDHPDPQRKQLKVLQEALQHVMGDLTRIPMDVVTEGTAPTSRDLSTREFRQWPLFLWYDYFSCPQLEHVSQSHPSAEGAFCSELSKAVDSIPVFSPCTWAERGWCRVERTVRELSETGSWVMVKSAKNLEVVATPVTSYGGSPGEGTFTVAEDRGKLVPVLLQVLRRRLLHDLRAQDLVAYRLLLNLQSIHLRGLPAEPLQDLVPGFEADASRDPLTLAVARFLHQNGFSHVREVDRVGWSPLCYASLNGDPMLVRGLLEQRASPNERTTKEQPHSGIPKGVSVLAIAATFRHNAAVQLLVDAKVRFLHQNGFSHVREVDRVGWSPLCYASLNGDPMLVRGLLEQRASPNERTTKEQPHSGIPKGVSVLAIAATFRHNAAVQLLVDAKAKVDVGTNPAVTSAALGNNAEGIRILCNAGGSPHAKNSAGLSAFDIACAIGSAAAVEELLVQSGYGMTLRCTAHLVDRLIIARADVDEQLMQPFLSLLGIVWAALSLRHRFGHSSTLSRTAYHSHGATPLMFAVLTGQYEGAAALIAAGARLDLRNGRGRTALDLGRELRAPDFLMEALEGRPAVCRRMAFVATAKSYLETVSF
ncbi:Ankyrin repeat domain-containing protein 17 [Symbiodinium microadriaticum]|uniref:Ankyrin repeat domain-containing protein 17 n=1 Tax=Symbiodinium microadriaticum TaxID=2951 RepID=A0A1Q9CW58_SYMMI|nr:Ankyrin repeat domain-containing protein 17 [Symbiodinium microadriaticum]